MSGSKKYVEYTTDQGTVFALQVDESNWKAVNGTDADYTDSSTVKYTLPRNVTPRRAVYANADGTRKITCYVATTAKYGEIAAGTSGGSITDPVAGTGTLKLQQVVPERIKLPKAADTGLNDGTAD